MATGGAGWGKISSTREASLFSAAVWRLMRAFTRSVPRAMPFIPTCTLPGRSFLRRILCRSAPWKGSHWRPGLWPVCRLQETPDNDPQRKTGRMVARPVSQVQYLHDGLPGIRGDRPVPRAEVHRTASRALPHARPGNPRSFGGLLQRLPRLQPGLPRRGQDRRDQRTRPAHAGGAGQSSSAQAAAQQPDRAHRIDRQAGPAGRSAGKLRPRERSVA